MATRGHGVKTGQSNKLGGQLLQPLLQLDQLILTRFNFRNALHQTAGSLLDAIHSLDTTRKTTATLTQLRIQLGSG